MTRLETVLAYLRLTKEEWETINAKAQARLFIRAEKEIKRTKKGK